MTQWIRRLINLFRRERMERELEAELESHLGLETDRNLRAGMPPAEARRVAHARLGGVEQVKERWREARPLHGLAASWLDVKLGVRMLVKSPVLSLVGGLGMAVAIAFATGVFTFMTFYYSDVPVEDGDRIVALDYLALSDDRSTLFDFQLWKEELELLEDLAAYRTVSRDLESPIMGSGPAKVAEMTASGFGTLRVPPLLGRPLLNSDEAEGAQPVVVLGHREWQTRFFADPDVIGREVRLDGITHIVVGVMPEGFRLPVNHGFWTALTTAPRLVEPVRGPQVHVFGRLAFGVEAEAAEAEAASIGEWILSEYPHLYERRQVAVRPYIHTALGLEQVPAWVIWLSQLFAGLILVAVAVNVAVLFFARTALRRAEIAVRTALGASRRRIVTQLFVEALALSAAAAAFGLLIAQVAFRQVTFLADLRDVIPYWLLEGLPPETLLYAGGLAAVAAVVVGVLPALQATGRNLEGTMREMGNGSGLRMGRTWSLLICVQVAVAVAVLPAVVGIAWNYVLPPVTMFPASEVLAFELRPRSALRADGSGRPDQDAAYGALQEELLRRVEALPEVDGVTFSSRSFSWVYFEFEDGTVSGERNFSNPVGVEYFATLGVPLLAGRAFDRDDAVEGTVAAVVNRAFSEEYFPGGGALGRRFREVTPTGGGLGESGPWFEVVGVFEDMLRSARDGRTRPQSYHPVPLGTEVRRLAAHMRGLGPASVIARANEIAAEIAPAGFELWAQPMSTRYAGDPREFRFLLLGASLATLSVLLLSAAGISAMMSFAVSQRRREVGIRTALGATRRQVVASIFGRSGRQLGVGLVLGAAGAALVDRLSGESLLQGQVGPLLLFVAAIMLLAGLLATIGPTLRALRIQPMEALREE